MRRGRGGRGVRVVANVVAKVPSLCGEYGLYALYGTVPVRWRLRLLRLRFGSAEEEHCTVDGS